jgi:uncharacterized surface protein with fasciclin (FAS1) repeats
MSSRQTRFSVLLLALVVFSLLAAPIAAGAESPANGITSPANGAALSGTVEVKGYASDPNFQKWQLDLLPGGDANQAIFLAYGTNPGEFSYSFDTSRWPAGQHALRLRVVRNDSNYSEYVSRFTLGGTPPATAPTAAPATVAASSTVTPTKDIVATAIAAGNFKTLVKAVQAAGLVSALQGKGPFTVFAPTDAAFAAVPAATLNGLLADPKALSNVLLYHVLAGEVKAAQVTDGLTAKTLQGSPVTFSVKNGKPMINDANIVATDIMASNGVIHVIDKVILPPATPAAQDNGITSPANGAALSGTVEVKGYANNPNFQKWQLDLLPGGDANQAIFLAYGTNPGQFSYTLDASGLPKGNHELRLRVVRSDSNYDEYFVKFTR